MDQMEMFSRLNPLCASTWRMLNLLLKKLTVYLLVSIPVNNYCNPPWDKTQN